MPTPGPLLQRIDPRRSLRLRVALFLGCSGLVFALLASLLVERSLRGELETRIGQALQREARLSGLSLATLLHNQLRLVQQLAGHPTLASGTMEPGDARALLESARNNQPELSWMAVVDRNGRVLVATQTLLEGEHLADEPWFRPGLHGSWLGDKHGQGRLKGPFGLTQGSAEPHFIDLAAPLIDTHGQTFGVVVAQLDWAWVERLHDAVLPAALGEEDAHATGVSMLLIGRDGRVELGPQELLDQPLALPGLAAAQDERPRLMAWPDGERYLSVAVHVPVPGNDRVLHLVARQTEQSAFGAAQALRLRLFLAGLAITAVFVWVSLVLAKRITAPVRSLADTARRLRAGEDVRFDTAPRGGGDELRDLASALNEMDQSVRAQIAERERVAEQYRALFESSPDANIVVVDDRITMANRATLRLFGARDVGELTERGLWNLVHPDDHAQLKARRHALREGAQALPMVEERLLRLDGQVVEVESTALVFRGLDRPALHLVLRDISERKRAGRALAHSEARFHLALQGTSAGLWDWDIRANSVYYTDTWEALLGAPLHELPASVTDWGPWLREADRARVQGLLRSMAAGELTQIDTELALNHRAGHEVVLLTRAFLVRDEQGVPDRVIGTVLDVTERHHARAELSALNERLEQLNAELERRVDERTAELRLANEELDSFSYAVSHDLRNPLNGIGGLAHLLRSRQADQLDETGLHYLDLIDGLVKRMTQLIEGLLALSRQGRDPMQEGELPLSLMAQRIIEELQLAEPLRKVRVEIAPDLGAWGDARLIDSVLRNLIGNAWKYTARAADPLIRVDAVDEDGQRWFRVRDNGAGFDSQRIDQLFRPFQRLHSSEQFAGIGLGLVTVRRIVARHGGQIRAQGAPGQGACFMFTLPRGDAEQP